MLYRVQCKAEAASTSSRYRRELQNRLTGVSIYDAKESFHKVKEYAGREVSFGMGEIYAVIIYTSLQISFSI